MPGEGVEFATATNIGSGYFIFLMCLFKECRREV
jgi:hypothetical protein